MGLKVMGKYRGRPRGICKRILERCIKAASPRCSMKDWEILPFVCRLKDAKAGKSKQNVIEISNTEESVKAIQVLPEEPFLYLSLMR
jgi:hypothetical protein